MANVTGSIYGNIMQKLEDNKQISRIAYDPSLLVHTAWDLGYGDNTAIVFFQQVGNQILIIDYYENKLGKNFIQPHKKLCDGENCFFADKKGALFSDSNHLSKYGAMKMLPLFHKKN